MTNRARSTDRQIDYKLALRSAARNYNRTLILVRPSASPASWSSG